jgi:hypothetical protein
VEKGQIMTLDLEDHVRRHNQAAARLLS